MAPIIKELADWGTKHRHKIISRCDFCSGGDRVSKMKVRDLISYSSVIYNKIQPEIFQSAVEERALGGKPETRAICIMLKSFIRT